MTYDGPYKLERAMFHEWGRWAYVEWYKDVRRHWFPAVNPIYWMMLLYGKRTEPVIYVDEVRKFNLDEIEAVNVVMEKLKGKTAHKALMLRHRSYLRTDAACALRLYGDCSEAGRKKFRRACDAGYKALQQHRELDLAC